MENLVGSSGEDRNFSQELENYEDSRNCIEQEETSTLESQATESRPTEWTNEKHSLYLKSMEALFVNQLYKSLDLFGSANENCQSKHKSSKQKEKSSDARSGQYKVFQDGCWSKIDFTRDEPRVNNAEDSGSLPGNPWIRHYRNADRQAARNSSVSRIKASSPNTVNQFPTRHFQFRHQDSIDSNTEVTGQNFNDEDLEEEKSGSIHDTKRTKTSTDDISSNDQSIRVPNCYQKFRRKQEKS
ncbi:cold regulated protein 27 [Forsythia ovata]|uniref:Cold regulated protein 27 n=1 Tax=Forsythia ovata TaxID=205694 RepID=A0ABD1U7F6_9LAMI